MQVLQIFLNLLVIVGIFLAPPTALEQWLETLPKKSCYTSHITTKIQLHSITHKMQFSIQKRFISYTPSSHPRFVKGRVNREKSTKKRRNLGSRNDSRPEGCSSSPAWVEGRVEEIAPNIQSKPTLSLIYSSEWKVEQFTYSIFWRISAQNSNSLFDKNTNCQHSRVENFSSFWNSLWARSTRFWMKIGKRSCARFGEKIMCVV